MEYIGTGVGLLFGVLFYHNRQKLAGMLKKQDAKPVNTKKVEGKQDDIKQVDSKPVEVKVGGSKLSRNKS
jgi:hypothetical protein